MYYEFVLCWPPIISRELTPGRAQGDAGDKSSLSSKELGPTSWKLVRRQALACASRRGRTERVCLWARSAVQPFDRVAGWVQVLGLETAAQRDRWQNVFQSLFPARPDIDHRASTRGRDGDI